MPSKIFDRKGDAMKLWYSYHVSRCAMDMLRRDHGYIAAMPPVDDLLSVPELGCIVYKEVPRKVFSKYPPTLARWGRFGAQVTDIQRVDKPTVRMYTVREEGYSRELVFTDEMPE